MISMNELKTGDYIIKVQANDLTSNKSINRRVELKLKDITEKSTVLSDILLLENIITDSTGNLLDIIPQVKNNFPEKLQNFYTTILLKKNYNKQNSFANDVDGVPKW